MPWVGVNPFEFLAEHFVAKPRVLGLSVGEDLLMPTCVVLTECSVCQTDRQIHDVQTTRS